MGLLAHRRHRRPHGQQLPHGAVAHVGEALFPAGRRRPGEPRHEPDGALATVPGHPGRWPQLHHHQRQAPRRLEARCRHRLDPWQPGRARHLSAHDQRHQRCRQRYPELHPAGGKLAVAQPAPGHGRRLQHRLGHGSRQHGRLCRPHRQRQHLRLGPRPGWRHGCAHRHRLHPNHLQCRCLRRAES